MTTKLIEDLEAAGSAPLSHPAGIDYVIGLCGQAAAELKMQRNEAERNGRPRYLSGFEHGVRCLWTDVFPPGAVPVIDAKFACDTGLAIAYACDAATAKRIADALNMSRAVELAVGGKRV